MLALTCFAAARDTMGRRPLAPSRIVRTSVHRSSGSGPRPRRRLGRHAWCQGAFAFSALVVLGRPAAAVDAFEIQVYDGTANEAGEAGLELHVNGAPDGTRDAPPPEIPAHHLVHMTLEPSFGLTRSWEIGGYLQTALRPDGQYDFAGAKLRSKLVTQSGAVRLGINIEVSALPRAYDRERFGAELRPILAGESARWATAAPGFEPAAMGVFKIARVASFGLEYYGDLGPVSSPERPSAQQHYIFEVANLLALPWFELNAGVGEGLTSASSRLIVKVILGYTFERPTTRQHTD